MKQFKLTLVLTTLMSMVGLQAFAAWDTSTKVQVDGLYYYLDNDNLQAQVTYMPSGKYTGAFEIPLDFIYAGKIYSVTSIGDQAFYNCSGLTSVTIGNSVTSIGELAFEGCSGLTSVTIPNNVTSIGIAVFSGCSGLTSVMVESGNTKYDSRNNCNAIIETASNTLVVGCKTTVIPNSVTSIGNYAFYACSGLTSVTIPNSVTSIGIYAFSGCSGLTSVTLNSNAIVSKAYTYDNNIKTIFGTQVTEYVIGDDVTAIGDNAFYGCSKLTSVTIGNNVTNIGYMTFYGCTGLTTVNIPDKVMSIGAYAFRDCSSLESLTIGNSVTSYGNSAFQCSNLTSVRVFNPTPVAITQNVFTNRTNATLHVPNGSKEAYKAADYWKEFKEIVEAGLINIVFADANVKAICVSYWDTNGDGELNYDEAAAVTTLSNYFRGNTSITSFDEFAYFTGVTYIGDYTFNGCSSLKSITIPNSVTSIGGSAFSGCSGLNSIIIPNSVTSIGEQAFGGCSGLTSVTLNSNDVVSKTYTYSDNIKNIFGEQVTEYIIGDDVTSIGGSAFQNCSKLTSVTIPNSVTSIGTQAFQGCSGLTSVTIPNSVTSIGNYAFDACSGLTSVTIPNSVTSIGNYAFYACSGLTSVTIPNSVTSIGIYAFSCCSGLTSMIVELGNTKYDSRNNCNAIIETASNTLLYGCKKTTIPNSVTSIGDHAFSGCSGLTSITIPNSVTSIGNSAFDGCSGLTSVTIPNSVTWIGWSAFQDCSGLTSIDIPNSVTSIGTQAFQGCSGLTSVTIPNSVTSIGWSVFRSCSGLTSVTISNSVTSIGQDAFSFCSGLTSVTIPNSVTSIGKAAFYGCTGLTSITIPNSVTSIGNEAFSYCSGLTSMIVELGNTKYDSRNNCNAIIETASNTLVAGCMTTVIPNSVTSIGTQAFSGCSGLTSVTIPNSVTSIGSYAFYGCSGLTSVTALNPTPVAITYIVFTNRNATLYVPKGSKDAYKAAAYWKEFKEIIEIDPTGIDQINFQENGEQGIDQEGAVWYTIDGKQMDKPKKGINIIRMKNGTTKKVVVK